MGRSITPLGALGRGVLAATAGTLAMDMVMYRRYRRDGGAQSVPTATKVPCIASYPAGWHFASLKVSNGESRFTLDSDRAGISAVRVSLLPRCDLEGATEIASDEPGTRRFERIISVVNDFKAVRSYAFDGGCITYRFDFDRQGRALVNEVSVAIGFIDRSAVAELVRERSGGNLRL